MAYSAFTAAQIAPTKPNKTELWQKVKDNDDNHETRIASVEGAVANPFTISFPLKEHGNMIATVTGFDYFRSQYAIKLTDVLIHQAIGAATSGTLEVDVLYRATNGDAYASIFSTKPSVAYNAGSDVVSSNQVLSTTSIAAAGLLRFDLTGAQVGAGGIAYVHLVYTFT